MSQAGQFYRSGLISTLTGDVGGAIGPTVGNIDILGGTGVSVIGNLATSTLTISVSSVAASFPTDAGIATPLAGVVNVFGGTNINTAGAGNTITVNLDNDVTLTGQLEANFIESVTYITAGTNITAVAGNISTTVGDITSGGEISAIDDITTINGDVNIITGNLDCGGSANITGNIVTTNGSLTAKNNITSTTGNIVSTLGSGSFATTVTGGTGITATTGNIRTLSGNITSSGTVTGATGLIATAGGVLASAGNIVATLGNISTNTGSISSATTLNAIGNITTSTGNLVSTLGSVSAGTTVTAATGLIATTGGVTANSGNIVAATGNINTTVGSINSASTITAVGNITTSTGDLVSTLGNIRAPAGTLYVATFSATGDIITTGGNLKATNGDVIAGRKVTSGTGITITSGGMLVTAGDVLVQNGKLTAKTDVTSLNGGLFAPNGDITAGYDVVAGADISSILGDLTAEQGDVLARYDVEALEGDIIAHAGDIRTLSGFIRSAGSVIADANLDATGTVRFRDITDGVLIGDASGYVFSSAGPLIQTGFATWSAVGPYFDDTTLGEFELLVAGTGYIDGIQVTWTAPQTVTGLTAGNTYAIYIDSAGTLNKTTTFDEALYANNIVLFEVLRDSTPVTNNQITVKENHTYQFSDAVSYYLHNTVGTVITNNGANITLSGADGIQINGDDVLADHGLYTTITDSAGVAETFLQMYIDISSKWCLYQSSDTFNGYWNDSGTPTAPTGTKYSVYTLYAAKDNLNASTPLYFAVLDIQEYNNLATAQTSISSGTVYFSNTELQQLELCQLGYIIYKQSTTEIIDVIIAKETLRSTINSGSGTNLASMVLTNVTNFDGILSASDTNVQVALDTIDEWGKTTTDHAILIGNGTGSPIDSLAVGATGEILIGNTGADASWSASPTVTTIYSTTFDTNVAAAAVTLSGTTLSADGTDADININITAKGTGQVIIDDLQLGTDLEVQYGGTGASTLTDHGVLVGQATSAIAALAVGADGQVLIAATADDPAFATITSTGGTITFTPGASTLNMEVTSPGVMAWTEVVGTSQAMAANQGYILNNGALVTATLPASIDLGQKIRVVGKGAGGWLIAQNAGQTIHFIDTDTTTGAGGSLASTSQYDAIELVCITDDTDLAVLSSAGNITII